MKKIITYALGCIMALSLVGCSTEEKKETSLNILCPTGAPSLAFVSEYENINKNGKIDIVEGSDPLTAALTKKDSEYDMIVAPINLGAKLIETNQTDYKIAGVLTWGNLYLVGTSKEELNGSGELSLFGGGSVPEKIMNTVNVQTTLRPTYYNSASLVQQQLLAGNSKVGMLAEPLASATIAKAKQSGLNLNIIMDLQKEYGENGYPQAAIFVKDSKKCKDVLDKVNTFTNSDYSDLKGYLEQIGIEKLKLPSIEITVESIDRQNIHYKTAKEAIDEIDNFLRLFNIPYSDNMLA